MGESSVFPFVLQLAAVSVAFNERGLCMTRLYIVPGFGLLSLVIALLCPVRIVCVFYLRETLEDSCVKMDGLQCRVVAWQPYTTITVCLPHRAKRKVVLK